MLHLENTNHNDLCTRTASLTTTAICHADTEIEPQGHLVLMGPPKGYLPELTMVFICSLIVMIIESISRVYW